MNISKSNSISFEASGLNGVGTRVQASDIQTARDILKLNTTASNISRTERTYEFQPLDISKNPVTKLNVQFYLERDEIPEQVQLPKEQVLKNILETYQMVKRAIKKKLNAADQKKIVREQVDSLFLPVIEAIKDENGNLISPAFFDKANERLETLNSELMDNDDWETETQNFLLNSMAVLRSELKKIITPVSMDNATVWYEKQEVIDYLQWMLLSQNSELEKLLNKNDNASRRKKRVFSLPLTKKQKKELQDLKKQMKDFPEFVDELCDNSNIVLTAIAALKDFRFFKEAEIDVLIKPLQDEDLIADLGKLKGQLTRFASSSDVIALNRFNPIIKSAFKQLAERNAYVPCYAFKTGLDNERELLGQKLLKDLRLDRYLLPKIPLKFRGSRLKGNRNPEGIASKWIDGKKYGKKGNLWVKWCKAKHEYLNGRMSAKDLKKAEKKLMQLGGIESIAWHILIDTIFTAGDSHINQYIFGKDGEIYNYDWAEFLPPHPSYTHGEKTFFNFRSVFLNHPIAEHSMKDKALSSYNILSSLRKTVLSWDVDDIAKRWQKQGLVGDEEFFQKASTRISELEKSILHKKEYFALRSKCFSKISPDALRQWKMRMKRMQAYLKKESSPTLRGAFEAYYHDFAIFLKVWERMTPNPTNNLMVRLVNPDEVKEEDALFKKLHDEIEEGPSTQSFTNESATKKVLLKRPLESIILQAINTKMATKEEITQMKYALSKARLRGRSFKEAQTAVNV